MCQICNMSNPIAIEYARALRQKQTPAENLLWQLLRNRKFQGLKFNRQYPICISSTSQKQIFYIADFYCASLKLVIELDGESHLNKKEYDNLRDQEMSALGIRVLRIRNEFVLEKYANVLQLIRLFIEGHSTPLSA